MISSKLSPNNFLFATNRPMTSVGTTLCPQHIRPRMRALRGLAEKRKLLRRLNLPSTGMSDAAPLTGTAGRVPAEDDDDAPHEQHHEHTSAERAQGALYLMLGTSLMLVSSVDGVDLRPAKDPAVGKATIDYILAMHAALMGFSGTTEAELLSDENPQKPFWHPKMMWFGPGGIGACRGMDGFVRHHQMPFRTGFPKRAYGNQLRALGHGEGHYVRIGDGNFAGTGGWPSVVESRLFTPPHVATHGGPGWLGLAPTGAEVKMRVMDFYALHEGKIRENWVPIDVAHIMSQMGRDVLAEAREHFARARATAAA